MLDNQQPKKTPRSTKAKTTLKSTGAHLTCNKKNIIVQIQFCVKTQKAKDRDALLRCTAQCNNLLIGTH